MDIRLFFPALRSSGTDAEPGDILALPRRSSRDVGWASVGSGLALDTGYDSYDVPFSRFDGQPVSIDMGSKTDREGVRLMAHWVRLRETLEGLRKWEQQKHRERLLVEAVVYALIVAVAMVPVRPWLPFSLTPLVVAPLCFVLIAAVLFVRRGWHEGQFVQTLNQLDHKLELQERAVTAWEILCRGGQQPWDRLVLEDAEAKLAGVSFRRLFARQLGWFGYAAPVLLIILLLTPWLTVSAPHAELSGAASLAQQIKEVATQLAKEARDDALSESLRVAQELEQVAEKELRGDSDERELGHALGAVVDSMQNMLQGLPAGNDVDWPGLAPDALSQLKERMRNLQATQALPESLRGGRRGLMEELGLGALDRRPGARQNMSEQEIREFMNKLNREATAEQDRRSLTRTREVLTELLLRNPPGSSTRQFAAPGGAQGPTKPEQGRVAQGSRPGDTPGQPGISEVYDPAFRAKVRSHLEGLLGQGPSRGFNVRSEGRAGSSVVPPEEVVVRYERQIEEQLAAETIPAEFKDTIKNYFLSLGVTRNTP